MTSFITHPLEVCCLLYHARAPDHVLAGSEDQRIVGYAEREAALVAELRTELDEPPPIAALPAATSRQHLSRAM
jgi:hypothetical protein